MLLGRGDEVGRIEGLLARAAHERASAALIIHGEPGVGKTSLLQHVAGGGPALRVKPLEAESELLFAGLADLVRPILGLLERLPDPQRTALAGALALGPPAPGDRFAVAAATLSLLAAAADEAPLLAIVDDAHWLDAPSRDALLFAARRLGNEGVVMLFAMREREWVAGSGIPTLTLRGLAESDAGALVDTAGTAVEDGVRHRIATETGGNPLAILHAVRGLSGAQLAGAAPITGPLAVGPALEASFARHLDGLDAETRRALLIAAASETGDAAEISSALEAAGLDRAAFEPAERADLITVGPRVEFRHPLIRSVAYHAADRVERRAAHRALAVGGSAWHLAAASDGPDEAVAARLEATATAALARSGYAAAASAFETAAELSVADSERLRRTVAAGRALWLGGEPDRALALLDGVVGLATDPAARADLQQLRGEAMLFARPLEETYTLLVEEAERIEPHDSTRAAALFAGAASAYLPAGELERADALARRAGEPAVVAMVAALRGDVGEAWALIEPHVEGADPGPFALILMAQTLACTERWEPAAALLERIVAAGREAGAPSAVGFPLVLLAELQLRRGRVAAAHALAVESVQLAAATGQIIEASHALAVLARVEAVLGRDADCRIHAVAALEHSRQAGARPIEIYSAAAQGLLDLARGRADRAAEHLVVAQQAEREMGIALPTVGQWAGDLVEAQLRSGAAAAAAATLAELEAQAEHTGLRWPRAVAARCRGLLGDEDAFAVALDLFGDDMAFERARTQLALGMRQRRAHRRATARGVLREALDFFEAAGAEPWAQQARAELQAAGAGRPAGREGSLGELTPQELQVALIVAKGVTNREAAASLFLSEKTVEFHLSNAYRKLGVRSRSGLVRRIEGLA